MYSDLVDKAYGYTHQFKKITILFVRRKFQVSFDMASKICQEVWLRQHLEARKLAKEIEK